MERLGREGVTQEKLKRILWEAALNLGRTRDTRLPRPTSGKLRLPEAESAIASALA